MNDKLRKDLIILGALIIGCSIIARFLAKGETLEEYAQKNPQALAASTEISENITDESADSINNSTGYASEDISLADTSLEGKSSTEISNSGASDMSSSDVKDTASKETITNEKDNITNNESTAGTDVADKTIENTSDSASDRIIYSQGFYYEPISSDVAERITGTSYVPNDNISLDDLRYVVLLYNDFNDETKSGELICNKKIAQDIVEIFYELYVSGYQIESIRLIDEFDGDDTASMLANNTSCFNYRVVENTTRLSNHAYGLAIDINPFYNPYVTYGKDGSVHISPEGSEIYADRTASFPYKIDENDLAYKLFKAHGFKWGGDWNSVKDYQHFEKK